MCVCLCEIHMVVLYLIYPFYPLFFRVVTRCFIFNTNLLQIGFNHFFKRIITNFSYIKLPYTVEYKQDVTPCILLYFIKTSKT